VYNWGRQVIFIGIRNTKIIKRGPVTICTVCTPHAKRAKLGCQPTAEANLSARTRQLCAVKKFNNKMCIIQPALSYINDYKNFYSKK